MNFFIDDNLKSHILLKYFSLQRSNNISKQSSIEKEKNQELLPSRAGVKVKFWATFVHQLKKWIKKAYHYIKIKWQRGLGRSESTPNFDPETEDENELRMSLDLNLRKKANHQNFQRNQSKSMRNVSIRAAPVPTTVLETTVKLRPGIDRVGWVIKPESGIKWIALKVDGREKDQSNQRSFASKKTIENNNERSFRAKVDDGRIRWIPLRSSTFAYRPLKVF